MAAMGLHAAMALRVLLRWARQAATAAPKTAFVTASMVLLGMWYCPQRHQAQRLQGLYAEEARATQHRQAAATVFTAYLVLLGMWNVAPRRKAQRLQVVKLKRVAQPNLAEAPTHQGGPWQQPQTKAATKEALKATGGLTKADLEFVAKLQRRQTLDSEGGYPTLPSAPTAPTEDQLKQLKTWRSSLAALQDVEESLRDHELIAAYQKKVDHLLGKHTTQSGEERESARLHRIMGTLKTTHAAAMDAHNKEKEAATRDLDTAKARLVAAEQAVATAQADFKRRQGQVADLLSHAESQGAESEDSGEHVIPVAPQMTAANLSSTCSYLIQKIREEHNLVGTDTPELNGVNNFCSLLVQEAQNAEVFAELQAAWKPPHAAPPSQDAASAASAGSGDTADRHGPDGPAAMPVPMDADFPEGW